MTVAFLRILFVDDSEIAGQSVRAWLFSVAYLAAGRGGYQLVETRARRRGEAGRRTLIVGAGRVGKMVAARLLARPEFGLRPVAFLDDAPLDDEPLSDVPVIRGGGRLWGGGPQEFADRFEEVLRDLRVRSVIVSFSRAPHEHELALVRRCRELGVAVSLVPRLFEGVSDQTQLERLGAIPLISVHPRQPGDWQFAVKYAIDRLLALIALILVSPVLILAAIGVLFSLGRPILFRQERVGLDGHEFEMLKLRTMRGSPDEAGEADAAWAAQIAGGERDGEPGREDLPIASDEDRRTRLGDFMRRWGIDELPQLLNVLRGEMSMVGPRPERRAYVALFERSVRRYDERHRVKAGITGWAQVHGLRGETPLEDRIEWDNYYIENWSPWLDVKIVLLTFRAVTRGPDV